MLKLFTSPPRDLHLITVDLRACLAIYLFLFCMELRPCKATNRKHQMFTSSCKFNADAQIEKILFFNFKKRTWKRNVQEICRVL